MYPPLLSIILVKCAPSSYDMHQYPSWSTNKYGVLPLAPLYRVMEVSSEKEICHQQRAYGKDFDVPVFKSDKIKGNSRICCQEKEQKQEYYPLETESLIRDSSSDEE